MFWGFMAQPGAIQDKVSETKTESRPHSDSCTVHLHNRNIIYTSGTPFGASYGSLGSFSFCLRWNCRLLSSVSVCSFVFVCLSLHSGKRYLWPWLGRPLTVVQGVM